MTMSAHRTSWPLSRCLHLLRVAAVVALAGALVAGGFGMAFADVGDAPAVDRPADSLLQP